VTGGRTPAVRDPYAGLAPVYDLLARLPGTRPFYRRWRQHLRSAAAGRAAAGTILVDLACGTGNSTIPWSRKRGWTVIGVDRSAAMLRVARRKSRAVRWVHQDLTALSLDVRADLITCHFDALNHVLDERTLGRAFRRVAAALRPGGLFQFDLNTIHMLRWLDGREKLFHVRPHWFTACNTFDRPSGVATFTQHWFIRTGRRFERRVVSVQERAFGDAVITRLLGGAGLRLLTVETQIEMDGKPMRKLYVAAKPVRRAVAH